MGYGRGAQDVAVLGLEGEDQCQNPHGGEEHAYAYPEPRIAHESVLRFWT